MGRHAVFVDGPMLPNMHFRRSKELLS